MTRTEKDKKEEKFVQPTLFKFIYPLEEVEQPFWLSIFFECWQRTLNLLSKGPMRLSDLNYELLPFEDVRDDVLEKLKRTKMIEVGWSQTLGERVVRRLDKCRKR